MRKVFGRILAAVVFASAIAVAAQMADSRPGLTADGWPNPLAPTTQAVLYPS